MTPKFRIPSEGTIALDARRLSALLSEMSTPQVKKMKQTTDTFVCKLCAGLKELAILTGISFFIRIYAVCRIEVRAVLQRTLRDSAAVGQALTSAVRSPIP